MPVIAISMRYYEDDNRMLRMSAQELSCVNGDRERVPAFSIQAAEATSKSLEYRSGEIISH